MDDTARDTALILVPKTLLAETLPLVYDRLELAAKRSGGRITIETIVEDLSTEHLQLWVVGAKTDGKVQVRAMALTEVALERSGLKVCTIRVVSGTNRKQWVGYVRDIEKWAAQLGCAKIDAWARKGWARVLVDYKMSHVFLEKDLADVERGEAGDKDNDNKSEV